MLILNCLLGIAAAAGLAAASPTPQHGIYRRAPATALARHTLPLSRRRVVRSIPHPFMPANIRSAVAFPAADPSREGPVSQGPALAESNQIEYLANVTAGNNTLALIIDTGSSDTWFVKEGFQCLDPRYRVPVAATKCAFGPEFKGDFPGGLITNQHFNITYGSSNGPFLNGQMGYSDLTVANLYTRKQQIGLATSGVWSGDDISSGILGLGLPGLTTAFWGVETQFDGLRTNVQYSPLVSTLAAQNMSVFSLALSREPSESFLAFGGVPAGVPTVGEWATAKLEKLTLRGRQPEYMYYQIGVEKMVWNSSLLNNSDSAPPQFIVDSGTTINMLPYNMAQSINSMFAPHAIFDPSQAAWLIPCDATPPSLGIQIGGQMLWTDPASMILPEVKDPQTGLCLSGIGVTSSEPYILGDTFMQGLVSVFDVGNRELRFAKRPKNGTATALAESPAASTSPKATKTGTAGWPF